MDQSDQNNKRSMRLFALFLISTTAIFCALFLEAPFTNSSMAFKKGFRFGP